MRSSERLALAIILGLAVLVGGTAGATAYAWHRAGHFRVAVHETGPGGTDLTLSLPGILVEAAVALCPLPSADDIDERAAAIVPALHRMTDQLAAIPDAVLVDVRDDDGTLRIEKRGAEILIRVASREERVEITVPVDSMRRLVRKLETRLTT